MRFIATCIIASTLAAPQRTTSTTNTSPQLELTCRQVKATVEPDGKHIQVQALLEFRSTRWRPVRFRPFYIRFYEFDIDEPFHAPVRVYSADPGMTSDAMRQVEVGAVPQQFWVNLTDDHAGGWRLTDKSEEPRRRPYESYPYRRRRPASPPTTMPSSVSFRLTFDDDADHVSSNTTECQGLVHRAATTQSSNK